MKYLLLLQCFVLLKLGAAQDQQPHHEQMLQAPQQFQGAEGVNQMPWLQAPPPHPQAHMEEQMDSVVGGKKHVVVPVLVHGHGHEHEHHEHGHGHHGHGFELVHGHDEKEVTYNVNLFNHKAKKNKKDKDKHKVVHYNNYYSLPHYSYPKYEKNVYKKVEHGGGYGHGGYGGGHGGYGGHGSYGKGPEGGHGGYGKGYEGGHGGYGHGGHGGYGHEEGHEGYKLVSHDSGYGKGPEHEGGHGYGHGGGHDGYGKGYGGHDYGRYHRSPNTCPNMATDVSSLFTPVLLPVYDQDLNKLSRAQRSSDTDTAATETTDTTENKVRQKLLTNVVSTTHQARTYRSPETGEWVAFVGKHVEPTRDRRSPDVVEVVPVVYPVYQNLEDFLPDANTREPRRVVTRDDLEVDQSARVFRAAEVEVVPHAKFIVVGEDGQLYEDVDKNGGRFARLAEFQEDQADESASGEQSCPTCELLNRFTRSTDELETSEGFSCQTVDEAEEAAQRFARSTEETESAEGYNCQFVDQVDEDETVEATSRFTRSADETENTEGYTCQVLDQTDNWETEGNRFARSTTWTWDNENAEETTDDVTCRLVRSTDETEDETADDTLQFAGDDWTGVDTTACRVLRAADAAQWWENEEDTSARFVRSTDDDTNEYVRSYRSTGCTLVDDPSVQVFVPADETNEETLARFGRDVEVFETTDDETSRLTRATEAVESVDCEEAELETVTTELGETFRRCRSADTTTLVEPVVQEVRYDEVDTDELVEVAV